MINVMVFIASFNSISINLYISVASATILAFFFSSFLPAYFFSKLGIEPGTSYTLLTEL